MCISSQLRIKQTIKWVCYLKNLTPLLPSFSRRDVRAASCFCSFLFGLYFEWGLSAKLINIIVQSHLFSWGELPAEIQTGQNDTDVLLRILGVCLPLEQRTCVRARARPHESHSLRHHWGSFHRRHPSKGFIHLEMKDEPFNPFL